MHLTIPSQTKTTLRSSIEIKLSKGEQTISRTDTNGNILYYNDILAKTSEYNNKELLKCPQSILRHPDMPRSLFFIIWQTLLAGNSTHAIIKNFTKNENYYWTLIKITIQKDNNNHTISFLSHGVQAPPHAIEVVEPLYKYLLENEKRYDMESSIKYLSHFLNKNNFATYNDYICNLNKKKKTSFFSNFIFN